MRPAERVRAVALVAALLAGASAPSAAQDWIGPNLLANPGFEEADEHGLPLDWIPVAQPPDSAQFSLDRQIFLVGTAAFRVSVPNTGGASIRCKPVPVEGGKWYLFSIGYRTEGFGTPGKYSGVDSSVGVTWLDAEGKSVGNAPAVSFPYHAIDWDLRDCFLHAPPAATQGIFTVVIGNHSQEQTGTNIPSTLWLDAAQLREYTPPPTPDWALQKVPRIVEGGISTSPVQVYQVSGLASAGGKWSPIVADPEATYDSVVTSPEGVGHGIMAHSAYFTNAPAGLYRAILRCKVADNTRTEKAGMMDIFSEFASTRAVLDLYPKDFAAPNQFQEFSVDFVLRTAGYWGFRIYTEGNQPFTADIVKVFPLVLLEDRQLLDLYPGSEGAIPAEVQPRKNAYPFTGLLIAGAMYDYFRIVDAFHLTAYDMKLNTVPIQKGRSQIYVGFPETPQALFDHNLIYLCGADLTALTLRQKYMIAEYVRRGGGLIVFGGHKSLDRAGAKGSLIEEILPVTCRGGLPPLVHFPQGAPLVKASAHPVTEYADLSPTPLCFFMHDLVARPEAQTIIAVADKPAIVVGQVGKGRVAVIALTCFGDPAEGQTPFWKWPYWVLLLRDLSWWVAGEDQHF